MKISFITQGADLVSDYVSAQLVPIISLFLSCQLEFLAGCWILSLYVGLLTGMVNLLSPDSGSRCISWLALCQEMKTVISCFVCRWPPIR